MQSSAVVPSPSLLLPPLAMNAPPQVQRGRPANQQAIDSAADNFESLFLSMLMKEMRQTLGEGSMFGQDKSDVLGGLFDHFMGQHLAPAGSLGIAAMVKKSWQAQENQAHGNQGHANQVRGNPLGGNHEPQPRH